jgi:hypothetical protein
MCRLEDLRGHAPTRMEAQHEFARNPSAATRCVTMQYPVPLQMDMLTPTCACGQTIIAAEHCKPHMLTAIAMLVILSVCMPNNQTGHSCLSARTLTRQPGLQHDMYRA